jgi:hypothetical protein
MKYKLFMDVRNQGILEKWLLMSKFGDIKAIFYLNHIINRTYE